MTPTNPLDNTSSHKVVKWIIILIMLGGIGYGIYWYFVLKNKREQELNNFNDAR